MYVSPKTHKLIAVESHYKGMLDNPSSTKKKKNCATLYIVCTQHLLPGVFLTICCQVSSNGLVVSMIFERFLTST